MQHPRLFRSAGSAGSLLLVLALAACPGAGDDSPEAQDTTIRTAKGPDAGPNCPPPPAIDSTFLADSTWAALGRWRTRHQVNFVGGRAAATAWVPMEAGQPVVPVTISPERRTHCLSPDSLNGKTRLAGSFTVQRAVTLWGHAIDSAAVILLFARDTTGPAVLAFASGDSIATAPATAWKFNFCRDGHPHRESRGEWRTRIDGAAFVQSGGGQPGGGQPGGGQPGGGQPGGGQPGGGQPGGGQPGGGQPGPGGPGKDDDEDPGTYGWMACANGCCQFYIPPVGGDDDDLSPNIPPRCITVP